jgi:hypothetical protein
MGYIRFLTQSAYYTKRLRLSTESLLLSMGMNGLYRQFYELFEEMGMEMLPYPFFCVDSVTCTQTPKKYSHLSVISTTILWARHHPDFSAN